MRKLRHPGRARRLGAALAVVIAIAAVTGIVLAVDSPSSTNGATTNTQASGAATVQRRDLVETDTESGTLSYASPQTVYNRLSGTITWLPAVGQTIRPGGALYKVAGDPVILMNGTTPAYRDLSPADTAGPDILELNRNLVKLDFNPDGIVLDDVWQPATTAAVEDFQQSLGQSATGILTLGQVVFLPGDQVVSTVETTLGSNGSGGGSSASASDPRPSSSTEFVSLTTPTTKSSNPGARPQGGARGAKTLAALLALLRAETAQLRAETAELRAAQAAAHAASHSNSSSGKSGSSGSGKSGSSSSGSGAGSDSGGGSTGSGSASGGGSATPILQTSSTQLIVTVDLDASKQAEAKVGEKVSVEMPAGNVVEGRVSAVSSVAQSSSGSGNGNGGSSGNGSNGNNGNGSSSPTIPVTIALSGHLRGAGLDQAAVSVNFAQAEANNVLSIPVTALLASSGGYAVQAAAAPHRLIPVSTGLFAAGYVEISGPGIYPGLEVTDSQG